MKRDLKKRISCTFISSFLLWMFIAAMPCQKIIMAGVEPFIGEIIMFGGNFAPRGWAFCDGQLLSVSENQALFSILGTTYGGDGRTTFALPDLRGRVTIHPGTGPGLTPRSLGEMGGQERVTLTTNQIPSHNHDIKAHKTEGDSSSPDGNFPAKSGEGDPDYNSSSDATMNSDAIGNTGGDQPHNNMPPFQTINFIIALQGIFPSRN